MFLEKSLDFVALIDKASYLPSRRIGIYGNRRSIFEFMQEKRLWRIISGAGINSLISLPYSGNRLSEVDHPYRCFTQLAPLAIGVLFRQHPTETISCTIRARAG